MTTKNLSIALLVAGALAAAVACGPQQPANDAKGATTASASSESPATTASADAVAPATAAPTASATPTTPSAPTASAAPTAAAPVNRMALVASGDAKQGAKLFEAMHCNNCHGTPEKPKSHNLFKITWDEKHVDEAFEIITKGHPPMPSFGDKLNNEAIGHIVAFLKANKK